MRVAQFDSMMTPGAHDTFIDKVPNPTWDWAMLGWQKECEEISARKAIGRHRSSLKLIISNQCLLLLRPAGYASLSKAVSYVWSAFHDD